jgi:hypothetical protein
MDPDRRKSGMKSNKVRWFLIGLIILAICSCFKDERIEPVFSFSSMADTLADFDSVVIVLQEAGGKPSQILFHGPVQFKSDLDEVAAPGYSGGEAIITLVGYSDGKVVYRIEKRFDGNETTTTQAQVLPGDTLRADTATLVLALGRTALLPVVSVVPEALADKSLIWSTSDAGTVAVEGGRFRGISTGEAFLDAVLRADPEARVRFRVRVVAIDRIPDSLGLVPDSLTLAVRSAPVSLQLKIVPSGADGRVVWSTSDSQVVTVTQGGRIAAMGPGHAVVKAVSVLDDSVAASAKVDVREPEKVASVELALERLEIFTDGAPESLMVAVKPALANPKMEWQVRNPSLASVADGRVRGLSEGETRLVVRSAEDTTKADSLVLVVLARVRIDSVVIAPSDTLKLFTGGPMKPLAAKVFPDTAAGRVLWSSPVPAIAWADTLGQVTPVSPGKALIIAVSRADGARSDSVVVWVRRDMPRLDVGRPDTTLRVGATLVFHPKAPQDFGAIASFTWDLDSDGAPDGSDTSLPPVSRTYPSAGSFPAVFRVKDTEGNDTSVTVTVKVVSGPAIQFIEPKANAYTNQAVVDVLWTVNDTLQPPSKARLEKEGPNVIRRGVTVNGTVHADSIVVYLDTQGPKAPVLSGSPWSNSLMPVWQWATGGGGGMGAYRCRLDNEDVTSAPEFQDTAYTPPSLLTEAPHTLYVQERDLAGNWSPSARLVLKIDTTRPKAPRVYAPVKSPTLDTRPAWTWAVGGTGMGLFRHRLDVRDLRDGATEGRDTAYRPEKGLTEGFHVLYVQERDSAGNWSDSSFASVAVDVTPPAAPAVSTAGPSLTNASRPGFTWVSGGKGGVGSFEVVFDTTQAGPLRINATAMIPAADLAEGLWTLFVREFDSAGNASAYGMATVRIDQTPPGAPVFKAIRSPLDTLNPTWVWASGTEGMGVFRGKVDDANLDTNTPALASPYAPVAPLADGTEHVLHIQERDSAGNWSATASQSVFLSKLGLVGGAEFTINSDPRFGVSMALGRGEEPYTLNVSVGGQVLELKRFRNGAWQSLPSPGKPANAKLILSDSTPIVAMCEGGMAVVKRLVNNTWSKVSVTGAYTPCMDFKPSLAIAGDGTMYVGYVQKKFIDGVYWYRPAVLKSTGNSLDTLPVALRKYPDSASAKTPMLAMAKDGSLYALNLDTLNTFTVTKWDAAGSSWLPLGDSSGLQLLRPFLTVSPDGNPVLAYRETQSTRIRAYTGTGWMFQSTPNHSYLPSEYALVYDKAGRPILAALKDFMPELDENRPAVPGGTEKWTVFGSPVPIGGSKVPRYNLVFGQSENGVLYYGYRQGTAGNAAAYTYLLYKTGLAP